MTDTHSSPNVPAENTAHAALPQTARLQDNFARLNRDPVLQRSPRKRVSSDAAQHAIAALSPKRLKHNVTFLAQEGEPPDPLDADPLALMASQSHLLEDSQPPQMQRGNSSTISNIERLPTASLEVGLPEAAGSSGQADDINEAQDAAQDNPVEEPALQQQLHQMKKTWDAAKAQHRLQLQERNRQIGHLQEDREKLKRLLKKAEGDVRDAQALTLCTVCQTNNRNCLILPCLHYLLCAGCLQQHTATCPFCPACKTKVSGLLVVLTSI